MKVVFQLQLLDCNLPIGVNPLFIYPNVTYPCLLPILKIGQGVVRTTVVASLPVNHTWPSYAVLWDCTAAVAYFDPAQINSESRAQSCPSSFPILIEPINLITKQE